MSRLPALVWYTGFALFALPPWPRGHGGGASLAPCFSGWRKGVYSSTKSAELSSRRLPRGQAEACPTGLKRLKWVPHATGFNRFSFDVAEDFNPRRST